MKFLEIFLLLLAVFLFITQVILPLLFNKPLFPIFKKDAIEEVKEEVTADLDKAVADVKTAYAEVKSKVDAKAVEANKLKNDLENLTNKKQ